MERGHWVAIGAVGTVGGGAPGPAGCSACSCEPCTLMLRRTFELTFRYTWSMTLRSEEGGGHAARLHQKWKEGMPRTPEREEGPIAVLASLWSAGSPATVGAEPAGDEALVSVCGNCCCCGNC